MFPDFLVPGNPHGKCTRSGGCKHGVVDAKPQSSSSARRTMRFGPPIARTAAHIGRIPRLA
eukprot:12933699-Prorocentrum_lima.AAC.1